MTDQDTNDVVTTQPQTPRRSGISGFVVGAALVGAGFAGAWFVQDMRLNELKASVSTQFAEMNARIDEVPVTDLTPLSDALAANSAKLDATDSMLADAGARLDEVATGLGALTDRVAATEVMASGGVADAGAAATYVQQVEARLKELESNAASITTASDELRADAAAAEAAARLAEARASLSQIRTALGNGQPYADALGPLAKLVDIPAALQAPALDGVPTLVALRAGLPDAARAALAATRENSDEATGGVGGFLRKQFAVRSTTVREGQSTDAVLSRVEAAVQRDDLGTALTELSALSDVAKAAMGDWPVLAQTRADAVAAADQVAQTLSEK